MRGHVKAAAAHEVPLAYKITSAKDVETLMSGLAFIYPKSDEVCVLYIKT